METKKTKKGLFSKMKEEERKIEKAAKELDIEFPQAKIPFGIKLVALFLLVGGLSLMGAAFTDIFGLKAGIGSVLFKTFTGALSLFIAFGLIKKLRWSLWLYGLLLLISVFANPFFSILFIIILVFLLNNKEYFKKGGIDSFFDKIFDSLLNLIYKIIQKEPKENAYDVVSIGSSTRDVLIKSQDFKIIKDDKFTTGQGECFALGSKIEIKEIVFTSGGGGTNAAVTFSRQGLRTACIGVIGEDIDGEEIISELDKEGIDTQFFQRHGDSMTAYSVILVHPSAERTILSYKGEGQHFNVKEILFDKVKTKWIFLDSLGGHYDLLEGAVNWAVKNGVKIANNPGGKELEHGLDKLGLLFKNADVVVMNQEEAAKVSGIDFKKEEEVFGFMAQRVKNIFVMTKGPEGVVVSDKKNIYTAGIPDSPVIERTGAGDAWSSGFVSEYIKNEDISKAIQFATANASSVVTKFGAKAGILAKGDWGPWSLVKIKTAPFK